jgi:hypothetical protein
MTATTIELDLYRSGLLRANLGYPERRGLTAACKAVARHAARLARHQINACNGIYRWDQKAQRVLASWTEEDQARAERETDASRKTIREDLRSYLTPGCVWDWKTDPRAGCVLRISDKDNRRDVFL